MRIYLLHDGGIYSTIFFLTRALYIDLYISMVDHQFEFSEINQ
jgi:hypothetical protein